MIGLGLIITAIISWLAVLGFTTPSIWALYTSQGRHGDPARLVCALFSLVMLGFLSRRLLTGEGVDLSFAGLMIGSIGVAAFTIYVGLTYGRGRRV